MLRTQGGSVIEITGVRFGKNVTVVWLGGRTCRVISAHVVSHLSQVGRVTCVAPAGQGRNISLVVIEAGVASWSGQVSYLAPSITHVIPWPLIVSQSGTNARLFGENFGIDPIVLCGSSGPFSELAATKLQILSHSHSEIEVMIPGVAGGGCSMFVTVASMPSLPVDVHYESVAITSFSPVNGPTTGGIIITINGINFGETRPLLRIGSLDCNAVNLSSTTIQCMLEPGQGESLSVQVSFDGQPPAKAHQMFSYYPPTLVAITPTTVGNSGRIIIRAGGSDFGPDPVVKMYPQCSKVENARDHGLGTSCSVLHHTRCDARPFVISSSQLFSLSRTFDMLEFTASGLRPGTYTVAIEAGGQSSPVNNSGPALVITQDCAEGWYAHRQLGLCEPCFWPRASDEHRTNCGVCPVGQRATPLFGGESVGTLGVCSACPLGTFGFQNEYGHSNCYWCPQGKYGTCTGGTSSDDCSPCPAGTWSDSIGSTNSSVCAQCPLGTWSDDVGASSHFSCRSCPAGTAGLETGMRSIAECTPCPVGFYGNSTGQSTCNQCPRGSNTPSIGSTSVLQCEACSQGKYSSLVSGALVCVSCPPGKWSDLALAADEEACRLCPRGKYSTSTGATTESACLDCPAGTFGEHVGANTSLMCSPCPAGTFNVLFGASTIDSCVDCGPGKYSSTTGNSFEAQCRPCASGKYSFRTGASSDLVCSPCGRGLFMNRDVEGATDQTQCRACPPGTYQPIEVASGAENCLSCQAGKYSNTTGSQSLLECLNCPIGRWSSLEGLHAEFMCSLCPVGTYGIREGGSSEEISCGSCPSGTFGVLEGARSATQCQACEPGKHNPNPRRVNGTACESCPPGSSSTSRSAACELCGAGKHMPTEGASQCVDCPRGKFSPNRGALSCLLCEIGKYGEADGLLTCDPCPVDRSTADAGTRDINDCACLAGRYANTDVVIPSAATCIPCTQLGMFCEFDRMPGVLPGYWYDPVADFQLIFPCEPRAACTGGNLFGNLTSRCALRLLRNASQSNIHEECGAFASWARFEASVSQVDFLCAQGYIGPRCSSCMTGFYRYGGSCRRCQDMQLVIFIAIIIVLLVTGMIGFWIFSSGISLAPLTIGIDFFQMLSRITTVNAHWSTTSISLLERLRVFEIDVELMAPECLVSTDFTRTWTAIMLTPLAGITCLLFVHAASALYSLCKIEARSAGTTQSLKIVCKWHLRRFAGELMLLLQVVYIQLAARALSAVDCTPLPNGKSALDASPDIICWEGGHQALALRAIVAIAVYVLGIPVLFLRALHTVERTLKQHLSTAELHNPRLRVKDLVKPEHKTRSVLVWLRSYEAMTIRERELCENSQLAGCLFERFTTLRIRWILVIMVRKVFITFFTVMSSSRPGVQLSGFAATIFIALISQLHMRPYEQLHDRKNVYSTASSPASTNFAKHGTLSQVIWHHLKRRTRRTLVDPNVMEETSMIASLLVIIAALVYYTGWAAAQEGHPLPEVAVTLLDAVLVLVVCSTTAYMTYLLLQPIFGLRNKPCASRCKARGSHKREVAARARIEFVNPALPTEIRDDVPTLRRFSLSSTRPVQQS